MQDYLQKKSLGQHWLHDDASLQAMCDAADLKPQDVVLEIGPGQGTLTSKLVGRVAKVIAVEFDTSLAAQLLQRLQAKNLEVIEADILKFNLNNLAPSYKVVANIPYYLTSNLLRVLSESANPPQQMALLVQKEVAERVVARAGDMSLLSVAVQCYYQASLGRVVPAKLFSPMPKVDSQILRLVRHQKPVVADEESQQFFRLVKAGFSNRRKTLHNSLSAGLHISKDETIEILNRAEINPRTRPQELSLSDWRNLYLAQKNK